MRVLGIDPGLTRCGMGVVEGSVGRPLTLVDVNVLRTSSDLAVPERLVTIEKGIDAWLDEYRPDAVAIERVFARSDVSTVMGTAAPDVGDGEGQGVGGIGRLGRSVEAQDPGHHRTDLGLVRPTVARHGGLDLVGRTHSLVAVLDADREAHGVLHAVAAPGGPHTALHRSQCLAIGVAAFETGANQFVPDSRQLMNRRAEKIDALAASLMLQSFLDARMHRRRRTQESRKNAAS